MIDQNNTNTNKRISIQAQYIKDLSFENPNAPGAFLNQKSSPAIDINVDIKAIAIQENLFEVSLIAAANATSDDKTMFVIDLTYAGLFAIEGITEQELEVTLMVYCPSILFPFVRRVFSDVSRDGGYPPLMLDPIDFGALYHKRKQDIQREDTQVEADETEVKKEAPKKKTSKKKSAEDDSHF